MNDPNEKFYFQQRNQNRVYEIVVKFVETYCLDNSLKKKDLAQSIGVSPSQLSHWLSGPGNWTNDTVSDLLYAAKAEMDYNVVLFSDRIRSNQYHPLVFERPVKASGTQTVSAVQQEYSASSESVGWKVVTQTNSASA